MTWKRRVAAFISFTMMGIIAACSPAGTAAPEETAPEPREPYQAPTEGSVERIEPRVQVQDQEAAEGIVVIEKVVAADPGWIVIHVNADGKPGSVIGVAPVAAGENQNVRVEIDLEAASETLFAMLHIDAGASGEYEFPGEDAPVQIEGSIVLAPFALLPGEAMEEGLTVMVVDSSFRDKQISVPVGTTVVWVHDGSLPHTVTSDDGLFNSSTLGAGDTFSYTFNEPGTFAYYCRFHGGPGGAGMSGVVTVTEGG